jgi:hypothetical protein
MSWNTENANSTIVAHARIDYRYTPFVVQDPEDEKYWDYDGYAPVNLAKAVPVPSKLRTLNWNRILKHIPAQEKDRIKNLILTDYLDLFIDGDHKVIIDFGVLRFKPAETKKILETIDLNMLCQKFLAGKVTLAEYRQFNRGLGYSLSGFSDLSNVGNHGMFRRELDPEFPGKIKAEDCPIWMDQ